MSHCQIQPQSCKCQILRKIMRSGRERCCGRKRKKAISDQRNERVIGDDEDGVIVHVKDCMVLFVYGVVDFVRKEGTK